MTEPTSDAPQTSAVPGSPQTPTDGVPHGTTRRRALAGAGVLAGTAATLSACGSDEGKDSGKSDIDPQNPVDIAAASDVPEGGAIKASEDGTTAMVTQPNKGEFKAFSSSCTHQGCSLTVQDTEITCPCHSSRFSITDGSVQGGPAPEALPEYKVSVENGRIRIS